MLLPLANIENAADVAFQVHDVPMEYSQTTHYAFTITINPNICVLEWYLATTTYANNMTTDHVVTRNEITTKWLSNTQKAKLAIVQAYLQDNPEVLFTSFE